MAVGVALEGGEYSEDEAVFRYASRPVVESVTPSYGSSAGGYEVTIRGSNLEVCCVHAVHKVALGPHLPPVASACNADNTNTNASANARSPAPWAKLQSANLASQGTSQASMYLNWSRHQTHPSPRKSPKENLHVDLLHHSVREGESEAESSLQLLLHEIR